MENSGNDLTKGEKGRLKKLRKKAGTILSHQSVSGLTERAEREELEALLRRNGEKVQDNSILPCVFARRKWNYAEPASWQQCEATDHRDLLFHLMMQNFVGNKSAEYDLSKKNGKRKRTSESTEQQPLPPWATVHSPACADSILVVEFQVESDIAEDTGSCSTGTPSSETAWWRPLTMIDRVQQLIRGQDGTRTAVPCKTRWFQSKHHPKSMSQTTMYRAENDCANKKGKYGNQEKRELGELILTQSQLSQHNYPLSDARADIEIITDKQKEAKKKLMKKHQFSDKLDGLPFALQDATKIVDALKVDCQIEEADAAVKTILSRDEGAPSRVFSIDCEMVRTKTGREIGRVTLLRLQDATTEKYDIVLDILVQPKHQVLDYLTEYSGISAKTLESVTTQLEEVQAAILACICQEDIIVGHSLENDMQALRLVHDKVIDTAILFQSSSGRKYALRHLSAALLKKRIQTGTGGHCSEEDAAAALVLALRRARFGKSFRIKEKASNESIMQLRCKAMECKQDAQPMVCLGPPSWILLHTNDHNAHVLTCDSIKSSSANAIMSYLTNEKRRASLVWANLVVDNDPVALIGGFIGKVLDKVPKETLILFSFQFGYNKALATVKQRKACMDPRSSLPWTQAQEQNCLDLCNACMGGLSLWISPSPG